MKRVRRLGGDRMTLLARLLRHLFAPDVQAQLDELRHRLAVAQVELGSAQARADLFAQQVVHYHLCDGCRLRDGAST